MRVAEGPDAQAHIGWQRRSWANKKETPLAGRQASDAIAGGVDGIIVRQRLCVKKNVDLWVLK